MFRLQFVTYSTDRREIKLAIAGILNIAQSKICLLV